MESITALYGTFWALLPPIIAIALALLTKEVYSSLFVGIVVGGFLYSGGSFVGALNHIFMETVEVGGEEVNFGMVHTVADAYNVGILIFLVFLGIIVQLMNRAGGSAAFGEWASKRIRTRIGAQLATMALGVLIFIDDYFNCLTVGSVMRPVTDRHNVSRAKLAYLIDATAAPVCIIAPISSWAAAVSGFAPEGTNGLLLFIKAIPYNYYAILTFVMIISVVLLRIDYGPMARHEMNAIKNNDLFTVPSPGYEETKGSEKSGKVIDLVLPIVCLVICCVIGMIYTGGFFDGENFIDAFANCDASNGLVLGSFMGLAITLVWYIVRGTMKFKECMECLTEGFKAMVPAIMILVLAWTLKNMTDSLGAAEYVAGVVAKSAGAFQNLLPAIIFVIACFLSFATGTSWGTFGILIPITLNVFPLETAGTISVICVSACMAGAVCGDHCSPISDTTIMSSAGAQCNHIAHVSTQMPYAMTAAAISFLVYVAAGFIQNAAICLVMGIAMTVVVMLLLRFVTKSGIESET